MSTHSQPTSAKPWKNREIIDPSRVWYLKMKPKDGMYVLVQVGSYRLKAVIRGDEVRSQEEDNFGDVFCKVSEITAWTEDV